MGSTSRHTSSAAVTTLLPKTLRVCAHPDLTVRGEVHKTDLYQIWTEPALQEFLQKPRTKIPTNEGVGPTLQECEVLQMKDAFVALLTIEDSAWKMIGGFQFKGDPENAEKIVANWRAKLLGIALDFKQETVDYQGHQIQADTAGIVRLPLRDGEVLIATIRAVKPLLDRVDGRVKDPTVPSGG